MKTQTTHTDGLFTKVMRATTATALLLAFSAMIQPAGAQVIQWEGSSSPDGANWFTGTFWEGGSAPNSATAVAGLQYNWTSNSPRIGITNDGVTVNGLIVEDTDPSMNNLRLGAGAGTAGAQLFTFGGTNPFAEVIGTELTFVTDLAGTSGFELRGGGTLSLERNNSALSGVIRVTDGTLTAVNNFGNTSMLIGTNGIVGSNVSIAAGNRVGGNGTLNGNLTLAEGAFMVFNPGEILSLEAADNVTLHSTFGVNSLVNADGSAIDWASISLGTYTLLGGTTTDFSGIQNFEFENRATGLAGGREAYFQDGSLQLTVIPEPSTLALIGIALGSMVFFRRRK